MYRWLIGSLLLAASSSPHAQDERARIATAITPSAKGEWPGCAVGVYKEGKIAEIVTAGYADIEQKTPITADSRFYIASLSKQFTALALLQLVADGKLKLDQEVRLYIPELPPYPHPITLRMLLNHTGGIVDDVNVALIEGKFDAAKITRAEALKMLYRQKELRFDPGTRFEYSNGGYLLLSEVVERVSGRPFAGYVKKEILQPLGMSRSFVLESEIPAGVEIAKGYSVDDGKVASANKYSRLGGSGGIVSTAADLARWDYDIDTGHKVWTQEIARLMLAAGAFPNGAPVSRRGTSIPYASGLMVGPHWFHHTGEVAGFSTLYARNPAKRLGMAMLCNDGAIDLYAKAREVAMAIDKTLPSLQEVPPNPHKLDGRYQNPSLAPTYTVETVPEGAYLTITAPDGTAPRLLLTPTADGQFRKTGLFLNPDDDNDGFTLSIGFATYHFDRIDPSR